MSDEDRTCGGCWHLGTRKLDACVGAHRDARACAFFEAGDPEVLVARREPTARTHFDDEVDRMSLKEDVWAAMTEAGFEEGEPGEFVAVRGNGRTRAHAALPDALTYARRFGVEALRTFLTGQVGRLERDADRNRFRERRLGPALAIELEERAAKRDGFRPRVELKRTPPDFGDDPLVAEVRDDEGRVPMRLESECPGSWTDDENESVKTPFVVNERRPGSIPGSPIGPTATVGVPPGVTPFEFEPEGNPPDPPRNPEGIERIERECEHLELNTERIGRGVDEALIGVDPPEDEGVEVSHDLVFHPVHLDGTPRREPFDPDDPEDGLRRALGNRPFAPRHAVEGTDDPEVAAERARLIEKADHATAPLEGVRPLTHDELDVEMSRIEGGSRTPAIVDDPALPTDRAALRAWYEGLCPPHDLGNEGVPCSCPEGHPNRTLDATIEDAVEGLLHQKPFPVCTCEEPVPGERDLVLQRRRCRCGGWISEQFLANRVDEGGRTPDPRPGVDVKEVDLDPPRFDRLQRLYEELPPGDGFRPFVDVEGFAVETEDAMSKWWEGVREEREEGTDRIRLVSVETGELLGILSSATLERVPGREPRGGQGGGLRRDGRIPSADVVPTGGNPDPSEATPSLRDALAAAWGERARGTLLGDVRDALDAERDEAEGPLPRDRTELLEALEDSIPSERAAVRSEVERGAPGRRASRDAVTDACERLAVRIEPPGVPPDGTGIEADPSPPTDRPGETAEGGEPGGSREPPED